MAVFAVFLQEIYSRRGRMDTDARAAHDRRRDRPIASPIYTSRRNHYSSWAALCHYFG